MRTRSLRSATPGLTKKTPAKIAYDQMLNEEAQRPKARGRKPTIGSFSSQLAPAVIAPAPVSTRSKRAAPDMSAAADDVPANPANEAIHVKSIENDEENSMSPPTRKTRPSRAITKSGKIKREPLECYPLDTMLSNSPPVDSNNSSQETNSSRPKRKATATTTANSSSRDVQESAISEQISDIEENPPKKRRVHVPSSPDRSSLSRPKRKLSVNAPMKTPSLSTRQTSSATSTVAAADEADDPALPKFKTRASISYHGDCSSLATANDPPHSDSAATKRERKASTVSFELPGEERQSERASPAAESNASDAISIGSVTADNPGSAHAAMQRPASTTPLSEPLSPDIESPLRQASTAVSEDVVPSTRVTRSLSRELRAEAQTPDIETVGAESEVVGITKTSPRKRGRPAKNSKPAPPSRQNSTPGITPRVIAKRTDKPTVKKGGPKGRKKTSADAYTQAQYDRMYELKGAYRDLVRAIKPALAELAERSLRKMEEDPRAHEQESEYAPTIAALDARYKARLARIELENHMRRTNLEQRLAADKAAARIQFEVSFTQLNNDGIAAHVKTEPCHGCKGHLHHAVFASNAEDTSRGDCRL